MKYYPIFNFSINNRFINIKMKLVKGFQTDQELWDSCGPSGA